MLKLTDNPQLTRRLFMGGGIAIAVGTVAWAQDEKAIDPPTAHQLAITDKITLIDIRRPDEWARTGSGQGAHRLDMRRTDFVAVLDGIVGGDRSKPVALICAHGIRSNRMGQMLIKAGYTDIIDIPEGMLGSKAGPGWVKRNLPLNKS